MSRFLGGRVVTTEAVEGAKEFSIRGLFSRTAAQAEKQREIAKLLAREESGVVRGLYEAEVASPEFARKLALHNRLARALDPKFAEISADDILRAVQQESRVVESPSFFGSKAFQVRPGEYVLSGSKATHALSREALHHELLHIGQYLRNPKIADTGLRGLIHEVVPAYVGSPILYGTGTTVVVGGGGVVIYETVKTPGN